MYFSCLRKKKYTADLAEALVERIKKERNKDLTYYQCGICGGYHLTSKLPKLSNIVLENDVS